MKLKAGDILFNPGVRDLRLHVVKVDGNMVSYCWDGEGSRRGGGTYTVKAQTIFGKGWRHISKLEKALS